MRFTDDWIVPIVEKMVPEGTLDKIQAESSTPVSLWAKLVERRLATDDQILQAAAARFRFPVADLSTIDPKIRDGVPEQLARRFKVFPLALTDSYLEVATSNPFDIDAEKGLAFATGREVRLKLASPAKISEKLDELYRPGRRWSPSCSGAWTRAGPRSRSSATRSPAADPARQPRRRRQRPVVRLVDLILSEGILSRASDIHIEPEEGGVAVRYRIDGVLRQVMKIPRAAGDPADLAHQDHVRPRHRRPAAAPGRPGARGGERRAGGPARLDAAGLAGREGRHPDPGLASATVLSLDDRSAWRPTSRRPSRRC